MDMCVDSDLWLKVDILPVKEELLINIIYLVIIMFLCKELEIYKKII